MTGHRGVAAASFEPFGKESCFLVSFHASLPVRCERSTLKDRIAQRPRVRRVLVSRASENQMLHANQSSSQNWWSVLVRDPHWWVPVIALIVGLVVLEWIQ